MFPAGTPVLDVVIGLGIIVIWTGVILHGGLLATVVGALDAFHPAAGADHDSSSRAGAARPGSPTCWSSAGSDWAPPTWPGSPQLPGACGTAELRSRAVAAQFCTVRRRRSSCLLLIRPTGWYRDPP